MARDGKSRRSWYDHTLSSSAFIITLYWRLGKAKSIGVSNFSIKLLDKLLESARIIPAINQVEAHPCLPQHSLLEYCQHKGLLLTAYSPVAKNKLSGNDVLGEIAAKHNASVAQVLLGWGIGRSTIVIPKSANLERLKENLTVSRELVLHNAQFIDLSCSSIFLVVISQSRGNAYYQRTS